VALLAARGRRPTFPVLLVGACGLYLLIGLGLLPAYEARRLSKPLGTEIARVVRTDETIYLVSYRPASLGCYLPAGHAVVQDPPAVEAALARGAPGLYVVSRERWDARLTDRADEREAWERLGSVRGLYGIEERELWIVRRRG